MTRKKDEPAGSMLPLPLQFLAAWLAVWLGRVLQQEVDYLTAENRLLREKLGGGKMRLTDAECIFRPIWALVPARSGQRFRRIWALSKRSDGPDRSEATS